VTGKVDVAVEGESSEADADDGIVGIPNFWLSAMGHHELISDLITEVSARAVRGESWSR